MSDITHNLELARRLLTAMQQGDETTIDQVVHPEARDHASRAGERRGREALRDTMRWLRATFADLQVVPEDLIATEDRIVARVRFRARQIGALPHLPATGGRLDVQHIHIWRVADGLLAEHWMVRDDLGVLEQLGAFERVTA